MSWVELLAAFLVCHLVGDFLLQTEAQAIHKAGGLSANRAAARALWTHVLLYCIAMLPALAWIDRDAGGLGAAALVLVAIAVPHAVQDDRRLLAAYARRIKGTDPDTEPLVMFGLDQTCHIVALCLTALAVTA